MRCIVLYGKPSVGKLTVAKELQKLTGYKLLHHYLTFNLVHAIFNRDDPEFKTLLWELRFTLFHEISKT